MNIVFASCSGDKIDQHFGYSQQFYLYKVDKESFTLLKIIDSSKEPEEEVEKLNYKIKTINDADMMYCNKIGPRASKMVQAAGIHPVRVAEGEEIIKAIKNLQEMLKNNPPLWLLRILHKEQKKSA